ncbi:MAG: GTP-binding protein [Candidatus Lokiarchaeota archaeon]|nr:GTP-binding protein [Candidatus Lokiarchaeota archaeon]
MDILNKIPVNLGLFGHIDSGKTAIAEVISEIISTAGIDAHPQSKHRGITIDLGFTSFILNEYIINLVDAPGHADLIKISASSMEIIDLALVVIDINKGPQIQTGEHLIMIQSLGIKNIIIILNKIDLFHGDLENQILKTRKFFESTIFGANIPIFAVSAKKKTGFDLLKDGIYKIINAIDLQRKFHSSFILPIDHYFNLKGKGTIITGTIVSGKISKNQEIIILPLNLKSRIKNIEIYSENTEFATTGYRVGLNLKNIDIKDLYRGCYVTDHSEEFEFSDIIEIGVNKSDLFKKDITFGTQIHITIGMITVSGKLYPYYDKEGNKIKKDISKEDPYFKAILVLNERVLIRKEKTVFLLSRLDLPPTTLRIIGASNLITIHQEIPSLYKYKTKKGRISKDDHPQGFICKGLAQSLEGARKILNRSLEPPFDKIINTFGTKGSVIISSKKKKNEINISDPVILKELRILKLKKI